MHLIASHNQQHDELSRFAVATRFRIVLFVSLSLAACTVSCFYCLSCNPYNIFTSRFNVPPPSLLELSSMHQYLDCCIGLN